MVIYVDFLDNRFQGKVIFNLPSLRRWSWLNRGPSAADVCQVTFVYSHLCLRALLHQHSYCRMETEASPQRETAFRFSQEMLKPTIRLRHQIDPGGGLNVLALSLQVKR